MLVRDKTTGKRYKVDSNFSETEQYVLVEGVSRVVRGIKSIVSVNTFKTRFEEVSPKPIIMHSNDSLRSHYWGCFITYDGEMFHFSKCHPKDQYSKKKAVEIAKLKTPMSYNSLMNEIRNFNRGRPYMGKEDLLYDLYTMKEISKKVFLK